MNEPEDSGFIDQVPAETARFLSEADRRSDADETPRLAPAMPRPKAREITPVLSPSETTDGEVGYLKLTGIDAGATVLHSPSGVVGVVKEVHGPGEYRVKPAGSETSGRPVSEPVVELEDGNAFLFRAGSFVVLEAPDLRLWKVMTADIRDVAENAIAAGGAIRIAPETVAALLRSVLSAQLRALSAR